jgi:hypothetical protein
LLKSRIPFRNRSSIGAVNPLEFIEQPLVTMILEADDTEGATLCGPEGGRAARAFQLWERECMVDEACQVERGKYLARSSTSNRRARGDGRTRRGKIRIQTLWIDSRV